MLRFSFSAALAVAFFSLAPAAADAQIWNGPVTVYTKVSLDITVTAPGGVTKLHSLDTIAGSGSVTSYVTSARMEGGGGYDHFIRAATYQGACAEVLASYESGALTKSATEEQLRAIMSATIAAALPGFIVSSVGMGSPRTQTAIIALGKTIGFVQTSVTY